MDMRIPPLEIKNVLESDPLKSTMLVGRLGVLTTAGTPQKTIAATLTKENAMILFGLLLHP